MVLVTKRFPGERGHIERQCVCGGGAQAAQSCLHICLGHPSLSLAFTAVSTVSQANVSPPLSSLALPKPSCVVATSVKLSDFSALTLLFRVAVPGSGKQECTPVRPFFLSAVKPQGTC